MSRWRRQQRKRARRALELERLDAKFAEDFKKTCEGLDRALANLREATVRFEVHAFEARLRRVRELPPRAPSCDCPPLVVSRSRESLGRGY